MKYITYFCSAALLMAGCGAAKKAQRPLPPPVVAETPVNTMESMSSILSKLNRVNYNTFSGKADLEITQQGGKKTNVDAKINMEKNRLIWISITGPLGIEGARALITKDSVKIINKLERYYIASSLDYLQEKLGLPLDLASLQDLLIGNPVFMDKNNSSYTMQGNNIEISSQLKNFRNILTVLMPGYLPSVSKLSDGNASKNRSAVLTYDNYTSTNNINFSTLRNIKVNYKETLDIQLKYNSFNFNQPVSAPFSIPGGYSRRR